MEKDRVVIPYKNIEIHLLENGYGNVYDPFMPDQNRKKIGKQPGETDYWIEYASRLPGKAKTRAAAAVAVEMESRGEDAVTQEIRAVLHRAVALARDA